MDAPIHPSLTVERVMDAVRADDCLGFCVRCGADADHVEPDARHYHCPVCGFMEVFGADEILIRWF